MITRPRPAISEPDPRYWRRRANRRVRKARFTRNALRWAVVAGVNVLFGAIVLHAGVQLFRQLTSTPVLSVDQIEVTGARRASEGSIHRSLQGFRGQNLLDLNLHEVAAAAAREPWVLHASAKRILPATVRVTVTERRPSAIAVIHGLAHLVDSTGHVVGPSGPGLAENLPVLVGLAGLHGEALIAALRRGVDAVERVRRIDPEWLGGISELDLSRRDRITVRTMHPGPVFLLDSQRVERNVRQYRKLRAHIEQRIGEAEYVDLRWEDQISVMPSVGVNFAGGR